MRSSFERVVGYIPKEDIHLPTLTVRETLALSSRLRCGPSFRLSPASIAAARADGYCVCGRRLSQEIPLMFKALRIELVLKSLGARSAASVVWLRLLL
jgi:hypothetical protein